MGSSGRSPERGCGRGVTRRRRLRHRRRVRLDDRLSRRCLRVCEPIRLVECRRPDGRAAVGRRRAVARGLVDLQSPGLSPRGTRRARLDRSHLSIRPAPDDGCRPAPWRSGGHLLGRSPVCGGPGAGHLRPGPSAGVAHGGSCRRRAGGAEPRNAAHDSAAHVRCASRGDVGGRVLLPARPPSRSRVGGRRVGWRRHPDSTEPGTAGRRDGSVVHGARSARWPPSGSTWRRFRRVRAAGHRGGRHHQRAAVQVLRSRPATARSAICFPYLTS